jgi:hypothetical protein
MQKKGISGFKGFAFILTLSLLLWSNLSGFAGETEPRNDSLLNRAEPISFHVIEFRLTPIARSAAPNIPFFTLSLRPSMIQDQEQEIFTFPQLDGKNPRILERARKSNRENRFGKTLYTASLLSLTALNIADYVSTLKALQHKELQEGNPLLKPFAKNIIVFSALKIGITFYDFYVLKKIYKKNKTAGWILSLVGNFAMSYVVSNNLKKIQAVTRK